MTSGVFTSIACFPRVSSSTGKKASSCNAKSFAAVGSTPNNSCTTERAVTEEGNGKADLKLSACVNSIAVTVITVYINLTTAEDSADLIAFLHRET